MDQKKTNLPHFIRVPKDLKEDSFVQMHLVGCLIYNNQLLSKVFLTYPNVHNDANLTITILHHIITKWEGPLPSVLYLQLDNTARENKNQTLLAFLNMLVQKGIFTKIKLGFLLVGHTHDQIDQMFSTFSKKLARQDAFTLTTMISLIIEAYTPHPHVLHLKETYDFRKFVHGANSSETCILKLNDLSFQHQFRIKKRDGNTYMDGKQYSSSPTWLPDNGLLFLSFVPDRIIFASLQDPMEISSEVQRSQSQKRDIDYHRCLQEKKDLIQKALTYARDEDTGWWNEFFQDQSQILSKFECNDVTPNVSFYWPSTYAFPIENTPTSLPTQLEGMVNAHAREMYLGARRSRKRQERLVEMWSGSVQDIKVDSMVATLAEDDPLGHLFWIAKVIRLTRSESGDIISLQVHWFRTKSHDAYTGKYSLEMVANSRGRGKRRGAKNQPHVSVLVLDEVDILVYDFQLTNAGHLRKETIGIIKQKLPSRHCIDEAGPSSRVTRGQSEAALGLHRDEDNVVVDSAEEDGSSTSSPIDDDAHSEELKGVDTDEDAIYDDL